MDDPSLLSHVPFVPSPNPFFSLPSELMQTIFSAIPNASTLRSLILTCSSFYRSFFDAESLIIKSVLQTQIGLDLTHDAIIVFESTTRKPKSKDAAIKLLRLYAKKDRTCLAQTWKLRDALAIGRLHDNIEFFSEGFASSTLSANPVTGLDEVSSSPLSLLESNRIKRSFYRYELFYNIFRRNESIQTVQADPEKPQSLFFSVCAPWENEQSACVREYLFDCLSLPFNDVAEHDVEWGELEMDHLDDWEVGYNYWKEHYLSLGLAYLRQLVNTSAFDERCRLLKAHKGGPGCSLFDALLEQGYENGLSELEDYTEEEERVHIPDPHVIDGDKGPEETWRWAYAGYTSKYWYNMNEQRSLRQRGYVMWDSARLVQWDLLNQEWDGLASRSFSIDEHCLRHDEMKDSFEARNKIWRRGGRGWWSAGDESRIKWLPPAPPKTMQPKICWCRNVWATDMQTWMESL